MSDKDIASDLVSIQVHNATVAANGVTVGSSVDNADFDLGLMFTASAVWTDGTFVLGAEDSDDDITFAALAADKYIGAATITTNVGIGTVQPKFGVFSNRRYVRPTITASGVTAGAVIAITATQKTEYAPA